MVLLLHVGIDQQKPRSDTYEGDRNIDDSFVGSKHGVDILEANFTNHVIVI